VSRDESAAAALRSSALVGSVDSSVAPSTRVLGWGSSAIFETESGVLGRFNGDFWRWVVVGELGGIIVGWGICMVRVWWFLVGLKKFSSGTYTPRVFFCRAKDIFCKLSIN
jgi:hypothetical protein